VCRVIVEKALQRGASTADVVSQIESVIKSVQKDASEAPKDGSPASSKAHGKSFCAVTPGMAFSGSEDLPAGKTSKAVGRRRLPMIRWTLQPSFHDCVALSFSVLVVHHVMLVQKPSASKARGVLLALQNSIANLAQGQDGLT
jgi:hypothetical protein